MRLIGHPHTGPAICVWIIVVERLFNTVLALKERGLLPDAVMRALVRLMCAQWVRTF